MKSPLEKLRGLGFHHHGGKKDRRTTPPAKLDELVHAAQEVEEMRDCYDSLWSVAATTTNSVYEFSQSLGEMGSCFLQKTALNDDEDSGRVMMMLGKGQFELQKLLDFYRGNIIQTISNPSESLLKELETVEEMKRQCDFKRENYESMRAGFVERGKSRHLKLGTVAMEQLESAMHDYQDEVALFIFRLKSLKQGQSRCLLTQAFRHHASQLNFFRRGLKLLETLEPLVKEVAEQQRIDYQFSGLEDDESVIDSYESYQGDPSDDGELSFDYKINDREDDARATGQLEEDVKHDQADSKRSPLSSPLESPLRFGMMTSQSAPILADIPLDPPEKIMPMPAKRAPARTSSSYVLPPPADDRTSPPAPNLPRRDSSSQHGRTHEAANFWHSSPLTRDAKEIATNKGHPSRTPLMSIGQSGPLFYSHATSDYKKMKREAFSGPIHSKAAPAKPLEHPRLVPVAPTSVPARKSSVSPTKLPLSPSQLNLPATAPRISELHELPRPPVNTEPPRPKSVLVGYSGPLVSRRPVAVAISRVSPTLSQAASPLPAPPTSAMTRSYSIPSNSQRRSMLTVDKLLEARHNQQT